MSGQGSACETDLVVREAREVIDAFERDRDVASRAVVVSSLLGQDSGLCDPERGILEYFVADARLPLGQIDAAYTSFEEILDRLGDCRNSVLFGFAHEGLAGCCLMASRFNEAHAHLVECEHHAIDDSRDGRFLRTSTQFRRGDLLSRTGDTKAALDTLRLAARQARVDGFVALEERALLSLTTIYLENGNHKLALDTCLDRRQLLQEIGDESIRLLALRIQELSLRLELGQHEMAGMEADELDTPELPAILRIPLETVLAKVKAKTHDEEGFRRHLNNAEVLSKQLNLSQSLTNVCCVGAELFFRFGRADEAAEWAQKSYELAVSTGDHYHAAESSKILYEAHKQLGHLHEALEFLETYDRLSRKNKDDELQRHLELADLRMELDVNRRASQEKDEEAAKIQAELEHRSQQLTDRTRHLVTQAGAIEKLRSELKLVMRDSSPNDPVVKQIRQRLLDLPEFRMNYEEFDTQFSDVHPDFQRKLIERFPTLTRTERRICPLLLLNLKSFEIGTLLSIDERSVETHRFNIRRKLGLKKPLTVSDFLRTL